MKSGDDEPSRLAGAEEGVVIVVGVHDDVGGGTVQICERENPELVLLYTGVIVFCDYQGTRKIYSLNLIVTESDTHCTECIS